MLLERTIIHYKHRQFYFNRLVSTFSSDTVIDSKQWVTIFYCYAVELPGSTGSSTAILLFASATGAHHGLADELVALVRYLILRHFVRSIVLSPQIDYLTVSWGSGQAFANLRTSSRCIEHTDFALKKILPVLQAPHYEQCSRALTPMSGVYRSVKFQEQLTAPWNHLIWYGVTFSTNNASRL